MSSMLKHVFDRFSPSKPKGKKLRFGDDAEELDDEACSFNSKDREFLRELTDGLANVIDSKNQTMRQEINTELQQIKIENQQLRQEVSALQKGLPAPDLASITQSVAEQVLRSVEERFSLNRPPGLAPGSQSSSFGGSNSTAGENPADPLSYVIGSLGRDTDRETVHTRAKDVLERCGVPIDGVLDMYPPYAFGSVCNVTFAAPQTGRLLGAKLRQLAISYTNTNAGDAIRVWCDRRKTKEERYPTRFLARMCQELGTRFTNQGVQPNSYIRCGASRHIYYETRAQVVGRLTRANQWEWGAFASQISDQPQRDATIAAVLAALQ